MNDDAKFPEHNIGAALPVVAIGASAGGLEQIRQLLGQLTEPFGAAFVVLQHLAPDHKSRLTSLLGASTTLTVATIEDGEALKAGHVHVLPPGFSLRVENDILRLAASQAREAEPTLIDRFFRSLAETCGEQAVGIVLSGTGSDGALGLKTIRAAGGLALVQNPDEAEFGGMPRAAAENASPGCVLATQAMIETLCNHLRLNLGDSASKTDPKQGRRDHETDTEGLISDSVLETIFDLLRRENKHDFRHHKTNMLKRRLERRMGLNGTANIDDYLRKLEVDAYERARLCADFLISVTDFFRDADAYSALMRSALKPLVHGHNKNQSLRVWVPGCATGEEAYSIAILLAEQLEAQGKDQRFIIFATDIDDAALEIARNGLYPASIETDVSSQRLAHFFDRVDTHYQVKRGLREHILFAHQSVTEDPPYSHLDLISCRNVLIYLNPDIQNRVIALLHFALNNGGYLFLGGVETIHNQTDLFEPIAKHDRLFRRIGTTRHAGVQFSTSRDPLRASDSVGENPKSESSTNDLEQVLRNILLQEHVPASILINRRLEVLCSYGPTRDYLSLPLGASSLALMDMVHAEFRSHLRAVIHKSMRDGKPHEITAPGMDEGDDYMLQIGARPLRQPQSARGLVLIVFKRTAATRGADSGATTGHDLEQELADELDATRRELHSTIAALEASNEDLKSSNEEIMSMNEELQSTNEELETSKEELQSVNEELTTVNAELEDKVGELETTNDDLSNLLAGSQVATVFLDTAMRIKRFTPAIRELVNLITSDVGRPLQDIMRKFSDEWLIDDATAVLADLAIREREIEADNGRWYLRRTLPYRTRDDRIKGVVITFVDISALKHESLTSQERECQLDLAMSAVNGGMWDMPIDPNNPERLPGTMYISPRLKKLLGFADDQLPNTQEAWQARIHEDDLRAFTDAARRRLSDSGHASLNYRIRHRDGSIRWFTSYGTLVRNVNDQPIRWIGIDCDISDSKQAELHARHAQTQLALLANTLSTRIAYVDPQKTIRFVNQAFSEWFNLAPDDALGCSIDAILGQTVCEQIDTHMETALAGHSVSSEVQFDHTKRGERALRIDHIPNVIENEVLGFYMVVTDITRRNRRKTDRVDQQSGLIYLQRMATMGEMASTIAHDIRQPLSAITTYASALTRMLHAGKPNDETTPVLRKIADQVEHANDIIDNTRNFVGRRDEGEELIDINTLVHQAMALTEGSARKMNIERKLELQTPLPEIRCHAVQIEQVIINLIANGLDAMDNVERDQRILRVITERCDAEHIQLRISDTGEGIPADKIGAIFDAFYTSKLEGMGMGLALGHIIVKNHGGQLWAQSQEGHGATFFLQLPMADVRDNSAG